ncbi:MAG: selenium metabolism-associated LysR family transcriptional regulator [Lachnospirales bacterium]
MDFKQLQSYVTCVKFKSLTVASEKLGIAQPTISMHLKNLEDELSTKLINRSSKRFELTDRGEQLYSFAQNILKSRDDLLIKWGEEESTSIRLGISSIYSNYYLPKLILEYNKKNDNAYFAIEQKDSSQIIEGVENGLYDIGLVGMQKENKNLTFKMFHEDTLVLVTPNTQEYADLQLNNEEDLMKILENPIIMREDGSGSGKMVKDLFQKINFDENELHIAAKADNVEIIKNLVIGGFGITLISESVVKDSVESGQLLQFELPTKYAKRELFMVMQKNCVLKDNVTCFIDFVNNFNF